LAKLTIRVGIGMAKPGGRVKRKSRRIGDASFQEVERHKHNFVSLMVLDVS
jgi:hypothetical protein